jgi:hypothetical protein
MRRTRWALRQPARLVLFFALAFGIAWSIWFVMRAAAIRPTLGPNFATSPGYLLLLVGVAGPTWAALLVSSLASGHADRGTLVHRLLRLRTFPNIDPHYYEVHAVGATSAEVTEGSAFFGGVWEHAHYDWSRPGEITITVQSSNAFTSGSFWHYSIVAGDHGGSQIDFTLHRVGKNLKGHVLATLLRVFGRLFREQADRRCALL